MRLKPTTSLIYDNIRALNQNGELICLIGKNKAEWYLSKNLAKVVSEDPYTIQLTFQANGDGRKGDAYYLQEVKNICVVCGTTEQLTRHHVVPYCYRTYFPVETKSHSSHDVLPTCVSCHDNYEDFANQFRRQLSKEFDIPYNGLCELDRDLVKAIHAARTLVSYQEKIPQIRQDVLWDRVRKWVDKKDVSQQELKKLADTHPRQAILNIASHGELMIKKINDIQGFIKRWREHFLKFAKPKFLPEHWSVERE